MVVRLVTLAELRDDGRPDQLSVSAWLDAELSDGRRVPLLRDRGWSSKVIVASYGAGAPQGTPAGDGAVDPWTGTSVEEIEATARTVVGPDEPVEGESPEHAEAAYWAYLAEPLRRQGIHVEPDDLRRLPHDVVLGERLRARLRRNG